MEQSVKQVIKLGTHKPKEGSPGIMTLDRMLTLDEVFEQVKSLLKTIVADESESDCNAYTVAEWISKNRDISDDTNMTFDSIMVCATRGNCEGEVVRILQGNSGNIRQLISIKYIFGGMDFARKVAAVLDDAFEEGMYA